MSDKLRGGTTIGGNIAWHAGNMGSGSGLDADKLDGVHASQFIRSDLGAISSSLLPATIASNTTGNAATATKLATARTITLTGDATGSVSFDGTANKSMAVTVVNNSHNHTASQVTTTDEFGNSNSATVQDVLDDLDQAITNVASKDPIVTLTGAITGTGTMTNLGNVSISTTATLDPIITLSGDASGSVTLTNLGGATLNVTVNNDSHTHDTRYYTESESNSRYAYKAGSSSQSFSASTISALTTNYTYDGNSRHELITSSNGAAGLFSYSGQGSLALYSDSSCMLFAGDAPEKILQGLAYYETTSHSEDAIIGADAVVRIYANQQGGYSSTNQMIFDGTNLKINGSNVWHAGNDGAGSGLDADKIQGIYINKATTTGWSNVVSKLPMVSSDGRIELGRYVDLKTTNSDADYDIRLDCESANVLNVTGGGANALEVDGHKVWNASNDGTGSGLDADKVDGLQASQLVRSDVGIISDTVIEATSEVRLGTATKGAIKYNDIDNSIDFIIK